MVANHCRNFLAFKLVLSVVGTEVLTVVYILVIIVYDLEPIAEAK